MISDKILKVPKGIIRLKELIKNKFKARGKSALLCRSFICSITG